MAMNKRFRVCQKTEIKRYKSTLKLKIEIAKMWAKNTFYFCVSESAFHELITNISLQQTSCGNMKRFDRVVLEKYGKTYF